MFKELKRVHVNGFDVVVNEEKEEVTIVDYFGEDDSIFIPYKINGVMVTRIAPRAFKNKGLKRVTFSEGLIEIGGESFANNHLVRVEIPRTVTYIGRESFVNNLLEEVHFKENSRIAHIDQGAFKNNSIEVLELPQNLYRIDKEAFRENNLEEILVPEGVKFIEDWAFYDNPLHRVYILAKLEDIGHLAFGEKGIKEIIVKKDKLTSDISFYCSYTGADLLIANETLMQFGNIELIRIAQ